MKSKKETTKSPFSKLLGFFSVKSRVYQVVLLAFSLLLYSNSILNDYNLDDELVTRNHHLTKQGVAAIPEIFSSPYHEDNFGYSYEYRPVVLASFAVEHSLFGDNPHISHLINVLLYAALCLLLFRVLTTLLPGHFLFSFIAVLLFAAHPIHTEVVASIKSRDEILSMIFGALALWSSLAYAGGKWLYLPLTLILFTMGLLSKPSNISFILIIPLAIMTFRDANFLKSALLGMFLILVAFFSGRIPRLIDTLTITIGSLAFLSLYWIILHRAEAKQYLRKLFSTPRAKPKDETKQTQVEKRKQTNAGWFYISTGLIFLLIIVSLICGYLHLFWLNIGGTGILCAIYLSEKYRYNKWIFLGVILSLITHIYFSGIKQVEVLGMIASVLSVALLTSASKRLTIVLSLALFGFGLWLLRNLNVVFLFFVFFSLTLPVKKIIKILLTALAAVVAINSFFLAVESPVDEVSSAFHTKYIHLLFSFLIPLFVYVLYHLKLYKIYAAVAFTGILVYCGLFNFSTANRRNERVAMLVTQEAIAGAQEAIAKGGSKMTVILTETIQKLREGYGEINNRLQAIKSPQVSEKKIDRPLEYIENLGLFTTSLNVRAGTAMVILGHYLRQLIFCRPLAFYYGYAFITPTAMSSPPSILYAIIYLFLFILACFTVNRWKLLAFSILWYLVSIMACSNFIQPIPGVVADRLLFIPSLGFCMVITFLLFKLSKLDASKAELTFSNFSKPIKFALLCILLAYSALTIMRNADWKNHLTLMRNDISKVENSAQAHNLLASNLMRYSFEIEYANQADKMRKEAVGHYKKATEIYPDFFNVWFDLGKTYLTLQDYANALPCFLKVYQLDSAFSEGALNLGMLYEARGDFLLAVKYYEKTISIAPQDERAYNYLGDMLFKYGKMQESARVSERAIQYNPQWQSAYKNLARVYMAVGDTTRANIVMNKMPK